MTPTRYLGFLKLRAETKVYEPRYPFTLVFNYRPTFAQMRASKLDSTCSKARATRELLYSGDGGLHGV